MSDATDAPDRDAGDDGPPKLELRFEQGTVQVAGLAEDDTRGIPGLRYDARSGLGGPRRILSIILLLLLGLVFSYADIITGISGSARWTGGVLGAGLVIGLLPIVGREKNLRNLLLTIAVCAAFSSWVASFRIIAVDNVQRHFQRAFWGIRNGMTRGEVEALMHQEFPNVLPTSRWDETRGWYCLENLSDKHDSEIMIVSMANGCVVGASYLPD